MTWIEYLEYLEKKWLQERHMWFLTRYDLYSTGKWSMATAYDRVKCDLNVMTYLRYCCNVWGSCGNALLHRLQTLQNRAVRVITNTSYENADHELLLKCLNLLSVEQIIQFDNLCVIYKTVNGLAATNAMDLF